MTRKSRIALCLWVAGCFGFGVLGAVRAESVRTAAEDAVADAVQWLKSNQNAGGSWGSQWEFADTADALRALRVTEPSAAEAAAGAAWIAAQTAPNHEYLARQILALQGLALYPTVTDTLVDALIAARNAAEWNSALPNWPEGGWGVDTGYETDCVTTAIALRALVAAGYAGGLARQNVTLNGGEHATYVFAVPADATQVRVRIDALTGDPIEIRLQEGGEPTLGGVPWFTIPAAPALIEYPDDGIAFSPGTNYLRIDVPAGTATFTFAVNYATPVWDTATLEEPVNYLRQAQNTDDGWGLQSGSASDIYSTLEVLLVLLQLPQYGNTSLIADGMAYVRAAQFGDGSFGYARGSEVPETALGAMTLMLDAPYPFATDTLDAIAYLVANQDPGGSWNTAIYDTALALRALNYHNVAAAGAPTVVIDSSVAPGPTNADPIPVTVTFSVPVTGFELSDVSVTNGTATALDDSAAPVYAVEITPAAGGPHTVTVEVAAGAAVDVVGQDSQAAAPFQIVSDRIAPTVAITSAAAPATNTAPIPVTVTFDEPVFGFELSDIQVANGTAGNFNASAAPVYTADITPTGRGTVDVAVDVPAAAAQDAAGNDCSAAAQLSIRYDTDAPTVTVTSVNAPGPTNAYPVLAVVEFNEPVSGFEAADITVANGAVTGFDDSNAPLYRIDVIPAGFGPLTVELSVAAAATTDTAGNQNTASGVLQILYDEGPPTVDITSTAAPATANWPIPVTVTFSEPVTGFDLTGIAVTNGTAANFDASAAPVYTAEITPDLPGPTEVAVDVDPNRYQDAAGNYNTAATTLHIRYDTEPPTAGLTWLGPTRFRVTFSEDVAGANLPANYQATPALTIVNATPEGGDAYEVTTARQTPGSTYDIDLGNITDLAGNAVADNVQFSADYFLLTFTDSEVPELDAGWCAAGTPVFDVGLDVTAPDPVNPNLAYVYWRNTDIGDIGRPALTRDMRDGSPDRLGWRLVVDVPENRGTTTVSWDLTAAAPGTSVVLQQIEGETCTGFPIDMTAVGSVVVNADTEFEVAYGTAVDASFAAAAGWSLIGVPVMTDVTSLELLTGGSRAGAPVALPVYYENGQYQAVAADAPLSPERAYWVYRLSNDGIRTGNGVPADGRIRLVRGWNLISPVAACTMPLHPDLAGSAWRWDHLCQWYLAVPDGGTLEPGNGYWLYLDADEAVVETRP